MIPAALLCAALLLHCATAWRYGYFRDELYFIACSKQLAWGYVDQPPLVALAAWLSAPAGYQLVALRALPLLAAAGTVYLSALLAKELGGGRFAQLLAGLATLFLPAYLLLGSTLTTTSFEPFFWSLTIYLTVRILRAPPRRLPSLWLALAITVALGTYAKYSMLLLVVASIAGLLVTGRRDVLLSRYALAAAALATLMLLPNLLWQGLHGWPFIEVIRGDAAHRPAFANGFALEYYDLASNAKAFALEQLIYTNPLAAPVWLAGAISPFRVASLKEMRFAGVAYAVVFIVAVALAAKGYYIVGIYAALLAAGAVAIERAGTWLRMALSFALGAVALVSLPLSLPLLPVQTLISYTQALGLTGRNGAPAHLIQPVFAEEFGWDRLARDVALVYDALPPGVRARTAIYADTYADAGAIDFFGPRYGLPAAISSQNNYYLWGTRGYDGRELIAIGATRIALLRRYYRSVTLVRTSTEPLKWIVEGPSPIYLCRDPIAPLDAIWPNLRWYGA
ncbi:MAG TPA: glycosyltransferase family 39 protein [Candidatus Cybelea sp.]|nr:glycosyltransferase family 39 protein [Candidatus Cybelea sp.]